MLLQVCNFSPLVASLPSTGIVLAAANPARQRLTTVKECIVSAVGDRLWVGRQIELEQIDSMSTYKIAVSATLWRRDGLFYITFPVPHAILLHELSIPHCKGCRASWWTDVLLRSGNESSATNRLPALEAIFCNLATRGAFLGMRIKSSAPESYHSDFGRGRNLS